MKVAQAKLEMIKPDEVNMEEYMVGGFVCFVHCVGNTASFRLSHLI